MLKAPRNDLYLVLKLSQRISWSLLKDWDSLDVTISLNEYFIIDAMIELGPCTWQELHSHLGYSGSLFTTFRRMQVSKIVSKNSFNRKTKKGRWNLTAKAEREHKKATVLVDQKALELKLELKNSDQFFDDVLTLFNFFGQGDGTVHESRSTDSSQKAI